MRILMLNPLTDQSGSANRLWSMGKELVRLGYRVLFLERSISKHGRIRHDGAEYRSIVDTPALSLNILRATFANLFYGLVFRPDYVFALKPMPNSCFPALILRTMLQCKIILDIDDLDYAYYPDNFKKRLLHFLFKRLPPKFDLVTTHNPLLKTQILSGSRVSPERIYFLEQGIEAERFLQASSDKFYCKKFGIQSKDQVIIYSASLGITSDFKYLLPMLVKLLYSYSDLKVLVIGDGERREDFARKISEKGLQRRVIFAGHVPHSDMPGILKLGRVGINYMKPTIANQCRASIKVREYLAAGLRVVCNPVGDAELFRDYLTLCSRIEDFHVAIREALDDNNQGKISLAQGFVERNYSWSRLVKDFWVQLSTYH